MAVKVASFKKLSPAEAYACSVPEAQTWARQFADMRIEFGKQRSFQPNPHYVSRPKIAGIVIAKATIDRQLKPALLFYPIPRAQYPESLHAEFLEQMLSDLQRWLAGHLAAGGDTLIGPEETLLVELNGTVFKTHRLRCL